MSLDEKLYGRGKGDALLVALLHRVLGLEARILDEVERGVAAEILYRERGL